MVDKIVQNGDVGNGEANVTHWHNSRSRRTKVVEGGTNPQKRYHDESHDPFQRYAEMNYKYLKRATYASARIYAFSRMIVMVCVGLSVVSE